MRTCMESSKRCVQFYSLVFIIRWSLKVYKGRSGSEFKLSRQILYCFYKRYSSVNNDTTQFANKSEIFLILSPEWKFSSPVTFRIRVDGRIRIFSDTMTSQNWRQNLLRKFKYGRRSKANSLCDPWAYFQSFGLYAVKCRSTKCGIRYARRRLDICKLFTSSTAQSGQQKQLRRAGKQCRPRRFWIRPGRTSAWWDNLVNPQWIRSESEYVWPGEFDLNTLWSHNVWTRIFSYPERKKLRIKKYLDKCGRSLRGIGFYWHKSTTRKKLGMSDWLKTGSPVKQWIDIWALRPFEEASFTGTYRHIALYLESVKKSI